MNATQALNYLRSQGLGIRTQTFYRTWGETIAALDKYPLVGSARRDRRPIAEEVTQRTTKSATGFIYDSIGTVQNNRTGEVYTTPIAAKFDRLVSYNTALTAALDMLVAAADPGGTLDGFRVIQVDPVAVREQIPGDFESDVEL